MKQLFFVLTITLMAALPALSQEIDLERGLISYYPFDDGTNDVVGINHGKNYGASLLDGRCGDMAYNFNGLRNYIDCGNDRSLNGNWSGLTISVWLKPDEISALQLGTILAKWAFDTDKDHFGLWMNSSYKIIMAVSSPGTMENGVFSKSALTFEKWHHVVGTWRRNGEIRIYIDGKLDRLGKQTGKYINVRSTENLKIGRQIRGRERPFKGWIDEVRIYKRALRDKEVELLYNQGNLICEKVFVKGHVLNKNTREPVQGAVVFEDMEDGTIYNRVNVSDSDGSYEVILPLGKRFGIFADTEDFLSENQSLSTENMVVNEEILKDIYVIPVEVGESMRLNNIFFDFAKATLREESFNELDRTLPYFDKFPNLKIRISGHTDHVGSDAANLKLSDDRAASVRDYLISQGIDAMSIEAVGFGESEPVASNDTEEGRQQNRRVEFTILEK